MHAAGERLLPWCGQLHEGFERRHEGRGAVERAIMRITRLDLNMQDLAGDHCVKAVITERDRAFVNRDWDNPDWLPTLEDIANPGRWVASIEGDEH
jgi:uncharacterized protein (DUF2342 family)